jgi:predicted nucleotidyltransferase
MSMGVVLDVSFPMSAVVPSAHGPVLAVLARTSEPLTGRAIAELTRPTVSPRQVATVLDALSRSGLVERQHAGSAYLYRLNVDHVAAGAVLELAGLRHALWDRMAAATAAWTRPPAAVVVYGSAARGDGGVDSDIDVLVVRRDDVDADDHAWQEDLVAFAGQVQRWSGNPCEVLERSAQQLADMADDGEVLIGDLRRDGVFLAGDRSVLPRPRPTQGVA